MASHRDPGYRVHVNGCGILMKNAGAGGFIGFRPLPNTDDSSWFGRESTCTVPSSAPHNDNFLVVSSRMNEGRSRANFAR